MTDKIVVGMSGGVDSSVTAWLLKSQGHEVHGIFMQNWEDDNDDEYCSIKEDSRDAIAVSDVVGIDIDLVNFAKEYKDRVFSYFLREYEAGRTPNPDVLCNAEIKFKAFLDHAIEQGASYIATGHYAQVVHEENVSRLLKGVDPGKDQSYFLYRLQQHQLRRALMPLGGMHKTEVREIAAKIGLPNATKKDSTGICFIGERPFREFLNRYLPKTPGPMKTPEGRKVGEHMGLMYYTLGQRKGLGIGGDKTGDGTPWFVAQKDIPNNTLIVVQGHDHPLLLSNDLSATDLTWTVEPPKAGEKLAAKTRYRQQDAACEIVRIDGETMTVHFEDAQWAVTPGQSIVLYRGEECLGGGIIM
ncbi:tRNA 2-thiouridine(34) synthase MnmA [Leeia sp. TBRC 13508]|uniref:tRNA-specific 2-thiouridylase MnmA n=1 Tax=Leeia speluncae TaxID=2884804 RepID=A0ABS8D1A0_9NEIS|nr:tRNA 2-thiouridine(34) synthase MnmA [Leeia speluncae]MCB6181971.1 tRNA 2-thiouridine(34) synthase MnmA [Leeia speluncae]